MEEVDVQSFGPAYRDRVVARRWQAPGRGNFGRAGAFDDKPLPNAKFEHNGGETSLRTDKHGKATLPLGKGVQRWAADYSRPLKSDPKARTLSLRATLVFNVR